MSPIKLIYNNNKNNTNKTIQNAITKTRNYNPNNKQTKKTITIRKQIKYKPNIILESGNTNSRNTNSNNIFVIMLTSKLLNSNKTNTVPITESNYINWLSIVNNNQNTKTSNIKPNKYANTDDLISYKIQKTSGIYEFTLHLYSMNKELFENFKEILNRYTIKHIFGKNKIERTKSYNDIIKFFKEKNIPNLETKIFKIKVYNIGVANQIIRTSVEFAKILHR